jgi:hypothetical protein
MKLNGFSLSGIYLTVDGRDLDLHNNFDFTGLVYDVKRKQLRLMWIRGTGDWISSTEPRSIELRLQDVSHFSATPRKAEMPYSEDDCLDSVSYVEPTQHIDESFETSAAPEESWHYVFGFMSGFVIRVSAEEAQCHLD